jgi:hypothetical protein
MSAKNLVIRMRSGDPTVRRHAGARREAVDGRGADRRRGRRPQDGLHEVHHGAHGRIGRESARAALGFKKHREAPHGGGGGALILLSHETSCWLALARDAALRRRERVGRAAQLDELPVDAVRMEIVPAAEDAVVPREEERLGDEVGPRRGGVVHHGRRRRRAQCDSLGHRIVRPVQRRASGGRHALPCCSIQNIVVQVCS